MKNKSIVALGTVLLASTLINNPIEAEAHVPDKAAQMENDVDGDGFMEQAVYMLDEEKGITSSGYMFTKNPCYAYTKEQLENHNYSNPIKLERNTEVFALGMEMDALLGEEYVPIVYDGGEAYIFVGKAGTKITDVLSYTITKENDYQAFLGDTLRNTNYYVSETIPVYANSRGIGAPIGELKANTYLCPLYFSKYNKDTGYISYLINTKDSIDDFEFAYEEIYIDARNIMTSYAPSSFMRNVSATISSEISNDTVLKDETNDLLRTYTQSMTMYEWMEKTLTAELLEYSPHGPRINNFTFDFNTMPLLAFDRSSQNNQRLYGEVYINKYPGFAGTSFSSPTDSRVDYIKALADGEIGDEVIRIDFNSININKDISDSYNKELVRTGEDLER